MLTQPLPVELCCLGSHPPTRVAGLQGVGNSVLLVLWQRHQNKTDDKARDPPNGGDVDVDACGWHVFAEQHAAASRRVTSLMMSATEALNSLSASICVYVETRKFGLFECDLLLLLLRAYREVTCLILSATARPFRGTHKLDDECDQGLELIECFYMWRLASLVWLSATKCIFERTHKLETECDQLLDTAKSPASLI